MYVFDYFEELFQPVWGYNDLNKALISLLAGFGLLLALYLFLKFIIETHRSKYSSGLVVLQTPILGMR